MTYILLSQVSSIKTAVFFFVHQLNVKSFPLILDIMKNGNDHTTLECLVFFCLNYTILYPRWRYSDIIIKSVSLLRAFCDKTQKYVKLSICF